MSPRMSWSAARTAAPCTCARWQAGSPHSATPGEAARGREDGFEVRRVLHRVPQRVLRLLALPAVDREAREFRPDVIIERYYNFGGEGVIVARRLSVPVLLEVNSPMIEYPGSL